MAPIEDFTSRDLAWISDFVMQQVVIMMRPMMDHMHQTDATVDYTKIAVHRLSMDISEVRVDLERTNKSLAILRQGLGAQNEGKCALQRSVDGTSRSVKRLDEQIDNLLEVMRGVEESNAGLCSDMRIVSIKQEELANRVMESNASVEELQAKVERVSNDAHAVKDDLLSSEARLEVWQRELRELRRSQLGIVPKLEEKSCRPPPSSQGGSRTAGSEPWPPKKGFAPTVEAASGLTGSGCGPESSSVIRNTQEAKSLRRLGSVGSSSGRGMLQSDLEFGLPPRSGSRAAATAAATAGVWDSAGLESETTTRRDDSRSGSAGDEACPSSRLPLLTKQSSSVARHAARG